MPIGWFDFRRGRFSRLVRREILVSFLFVELGHDGMCEITKKIREFYDSLSKCFLADYTFLQSAIHVYQTNSRTLISRHRKVPSENNRQKKAKRGLASTDLETRLRVARSGGNAAHSERGLQNASSETRSRVARLGGLARQAQRRKSKK